MVFTSVPDGQASTVQSWIPFMKSILLHRQFGSAAPLGQPSAEALANMFLMHVCYVVVSNRSSEM